MRSPARRTSPLRPVRNPGFLSAWKWALAKENCGRAQGVSVNRPPGGGHDREQIGPAHRAKIVLPPRQLKIARRLTNDYHGGDNSPAGALATDLSNTTCKGIAGPTGAPWSAQACCSSSPCRQWPSVDHRADRHHQTSPRYGAEISSPKARNQHKPKSTKTGMALRVITAVTPSSSEQHHHHRDDHDASCSEHLTLLIAVSMKLA